MREKALAAFREGRISVLVATDVAARGIDIDDITHVINYQCPEDEKIYVHRVGRTGRAGRTGIAVTFVDWDDVPRWSLISRALNLGFESPVETYSTSPHFFEDLDIPAGTKGRLTRRKPSAGEDAGDSRRSESRGGRGCGTAAIRIAEARAVATRAVAAATEIRPAVGRAGALAADRTPRPPHSRQHPRLHPPPRPARARPRTAPAVVVVAVAAVPAAASSLHRCPHRTDTGSRSGTHLILASAVHPHSSLGRTEVGISAFMPQPNPMSGPVSKTNRTSR